MGKPYSKDLRERAVTAVSEGLSRNEAAELFSVGVASVVRWVARYEQTGELAARPMGGSRGSRIEGADRQWLLDRIEAQPDLTLEELRHELAAQRGLEVGYGSVWRFCAREKLTFKKKSARGPAGSA